MTAQGMAAIAAETEALNKAIADAIKTTLKDQPASPDLPPVTETSLAALAQATRNNLKWIRDYGGGGDTDWKAEVEKIKEALPPDFSGQGRLSGGGAGRNSHQVTRARTGAVKHF